MTSAIRENTQRPTGNGTSIGWIGCLAIVAAMRTALLPEMLLRSAEKAIPMWTIPARSCTGTLTQSARLRAGVMLGPRPARADAPERVAQHPRTHEPRPRARTRRHRDHQRQRVEPRHALDRAPLGIQAEAVDGGPLERTAAQGRAQAELDEERAVAGTTAVDLAAHVRQRREHAGEPRPHLGD